MKKSGNFVLVAVLLSGCAATTVQETSLDRIENIVVIYAENNSFDNLYGLFPCAIGGTNATAEQRTQLDHDGTPLPHLPPVYNAGKVDPRYPANLPNGPFRIDAPPINARIDQIGTG